MSPFLHDEDSFAEISRRMSQTAEQLYAAAIQAAGVHAPAVRERHGRFRKRLDEAASRGTLSQRVGHVSSYLWSAYSVAAGYGVRVDLEPYVDELLELGRKYLKRRTA